MDLGQRRPEGKLPICPQGPGAPVLATPTPHFQNKQSKGPWLWLATWLYLQKPRGGAKRKPGSMGNQNLAAGRRCTPCFMSSTPCGLPGSPYFSSATCDPRSSCKKVRIRVPLFSVVYFSRGTLPQQRIKGHYWGT